MMNVRLARAAAVDIEILLSRSEAEFGTDARQRYQRLVRCALGLLGSHAAGVAHRDDLQPNLHTFHLALARRKARLQGPTVSRPRHFLVWRFADEETIEVVRVLHDAMDLPRHLPPLSDEP